MNNAKLYALISFFPLVQRTSMPQKKCMTKADPSFILNQRPVKVEECIRETLEFSLNEFTECRES